MKMKGGKTNMTIEAVILQVDHFIYNCSGNRNSSTGKGGGRINVTDERFGLVAKNKHFSP